VNYIPGVFDTRIVDLPTVMYGGDQKVLHQARECVSSVSKAQYLLFTFVCEFEAEHFKVGLPFSVYPIGPAIPYFELQQNSSIPYGRSRWRQVLSLVARLSTYMLCIVHLIRKFLCDFKCPDG
jgi:hypothetical protein